MITFMNPTQQGGSLRQLILTLEHPGSAYSLLPYVGTRMTIEFFPASPQEAQLMLEITLCFYARLPISRILNALGFSWKLLVSVYTYVDRLTI